MFRIYKVLKHCLPYLVIANLFVDYVSSKILLPGSKMNSKEQSDPSGDEETFFVKELFSKYGHDGYMNFEGFEHLLSSLGLGKVVIDDHELADHKRLNSTSFVQSHNDHAHVGDKSDSKLDEDLKDRHKRRTDNLLQKSETYRKNNSEIKQGRKSKETSLLKEKVVDVNECLSPSRLLKAFNISSKNNISISNFLHLCPAIVYELDERHCHNGGGPTAANHTHHFGSAESKNPNRFSDMNVWLYASAAIIVISLCGLISVGAVPLMQKVFYHQLLQFLVALAIGTLSGDALLHLIPHALGSHDDGNEAEEDVTAVWKGLTALLGIYTFFIMERLMNIIHHCIRRPKDENAKHLAHKVPSLVASKKSIGEKLSQHQKNDSYGFMDPKATVHLLNRNGDLSTKAKSSSVVSLSKSSKDWEANVNVQSSSHNHLHDSTEHCDADDTFPQVTKLAEHSHGHSHEIPNSMSAVAMMVVMGDGFHNFTDGLAIGAAFASNITGGLSTSIAVFCHELPHELGDFAVLLKSGMTTRRALFYNILSSVLCFLGMLIGVALGNIESFTIWIFAMAGGMFIYISLVDMVPQLIGSTSDNPHILDLALQLIGIGIGISLMLVIALYEHDIKKAIN